MRWREVAEWKNTAHLAMLSSHMLLPNSQDQAMNGQTAEVRSLVTGQTLRLLVLLDWSEQVGWVWALCLKE